MGAGSGEGGSWTASFDVAHPMLEEKKREDNCVCVLHNLSGADRDETTKHSHFHILPVMMILREYPVHVQYESFHCVRGIAARRRHADG